MYSSIHFTHFTSFIIRFFTHKCANIPFNRIIPTSNFINFFPKKSFHLEVTTEAVPGVPLLVVLADDDGDGVRPDGVTADASQSITHGVTSLIRNHVGQVALQKLKHKLRNIDIKK